MDELKKLYDVLTRDGYYTKSFEDFQKQFQDTSYQDKVYSAISRDGLFTKSKDEFLGKYLKKKDDTMVLPSADGLSGSSITDSTVDNTQSSFTIPIDKSQIVSRDNTIVSGPIDEFELNEEAFVSDSDLVKDDEITSKPTPPKKEQGFGSYLKNALDVGVSTVSKSVYDLPAFIYDSAAMFTNPIARLFGIEEASSEKFTEVFGLKNVPSETIGKRIEEKRKEIQEYNDKNGGDALAALEDGNVLGAAKMIAGTTAESLPLMIAAFMSRGLVMRVGVVGGSTASTKAAQLKEESPEMDVTSRTLNAVATGTLEATLGELLTGASGAVTKRILVNEGSKKGAKILSDSFKSVLENTIEKNPLLPIFGEILEESLVSVGEQLTDISTGVRTDFDMREVINSGISSIGMGGVNTVAIYGAKGYVSAKDYVKLKQINKDLSKLSNEVLVSDLPSEEKELLNKSIERLKSQGKKVVDDAESRVLSLPEESTKELNNIILQLDGISVDAFKVKSNKDIPDNVKAVMLNELKYQAKELTDKKNEILSKGYELNELETQDKLLTNSIKEQVRQGNPDLNEPSLNAITELEKELKKLDGNSTQTGKDKAAAIRKQIKNIEENQIQEEAAIETLTAEQNAVQTQVETLRAQEQTELMEAIPNATQYVVDGKVDRTKIADTNDLKVFDEIYDKYDKLITPLLETTEVSSKTRLDELTEAIPQRVDYTENDLTNFDTLEDTKAKGVITALAEKVNEGTKLTPVEQSVYDANKAQVDEVSGLVAERTAIQEEVADLDTLISESQPAPAEAAVQPRVELTDDQIVEYNPTEEVDDKNNEVLGKVLQSKKVNPQAEPLITDLGNSVVFEYNNFDDNETRTRLTFNKKKDGTITGVGVKVERNAGNIRGTDLFRNYVNSKRAAATQTAPQTIIEEEVSSKTQSINKIEKQNETKQQPTVQSERTGDRTRRDESRKIETLEGAPTIQGATGPDTKLVAVADKYAADNGIDLKRQSEYVVVDEERAKRIADAYEQMVNDPQNPKVKEAYEDLIRQTKAQYDALVDAGYEFTFFDDETDPYEGNPYNAMRDLRKNKKMAVYGTFAGYGTEGITDSEVENNPLLVDTGLRWKDQNGNEQIVTANDLFRAVHDAFGHGLEGSGFRARGEENAWQAHVRLFKGPAIAALTSETRGQNSWLNYGPFGENNKKAKVEDTVFAQQKVGLMPEFTWTEGRAGDVDTKTADQDVASISEELLAENGLTEQEFVNAAANGNLSNATKLINFLNKTFPSVTITTDKVSFDNVMAQVGTESFVLGDQIIYGVTVDGDIYINPDVHNSESALFNTTIHEFGHVWTDYLQASKKGKTVYSRGVQLVEEAIDNDKSVKKIFDAQMKKYPEDRTRAINETMAILIGNKGEVIVNQGLKSKFKEWLLGVWTFVKENFKMSKDLTPQEIQNLTLDGFIETALADVFNGSEISLTKAQKKVLKNPDAMFSSNQSMQSIIQQARANGFSDAAIKQVLITRGFKARDVNNALVVQIDITTDLPREFANVQGGVQKGYQLFTEVRAKLQNFAYMGPRGGVGTQQTKTWSQIREKAIELLKENPIYKAQADTVQMELISAFDRTLNTSANTNVTRQISAIRNNLRQRKIGAKELQQAKIAVKNLIRSVLPKSNMYSQAQINKLISIISNATEASILSDTLKVTKIVEQQRGKMKTSVLKKMIELVNKKAKPAMTTTGKRRSRGLDPEGQAFFAQVKPILKAVIKGDAQFLIDIATELSQADADGSISDIILKENRGETVTVQEKALLNKAYAYDTFGDLMSMELEDVEQLLKELEGVRSESIRKLKTRREVRAMRYAVLNEQATAQVSDLNPELFVEEEVSATLSKNEVGALQVGDKVEIKSFASGELTVEFVDPNGEFVDFTDGESSFKVSLDENSDIPEISKKETIVRPKSRNELVQDKAAIRKSFQNGEIWSGFKKLAERWDYLTITGMKDFARKRLFHLGTIMNLFDNNAKKMNFFTDNIYRPLNRMDEKSKVGYFFEMDNLDAMANSISGITKGYKQIRNMLQTGIHTFTINGQEQVYNADKLLRIYALSLNDVQGDKLKQMGWDEAQINKIKDIVGAEPIEFADKLIEYFSNDYYESINNVYSYVNDVNLGYIPNYFPTITQSTKVNSKLLDDGDFNGVFNAETAPALKERTDVSGLIELNYDFSDVVESHFVSMEKYKAYAEGVKDLNAIFQNPAYNVLLEQSGLKKVVKNSVNFAITPNAGQKEQQTSLGKIMTKFTGFALAFKAVQILKQSTSFITAYENYNYFPTDSTIPKAVRGPIDLMMFMVDTAYTIATMPTQIRKAYGMSASFRDRLVKGVQGDVYGLESGSSVFSPISKRSDLWARAVRAYKTGAAGPTVIGDVLGVMGYMVNYNRNIANGMSEAEALEAFNDYNPTQQTRRGTEKIPLQQSNSELTRAFTMFGSTVFLQINKVLAAQTNMFRSVKEGKVPSSKDIRGFVLNLGLANALFVGTANIAKFIKGEDDDREEVLEQMAKALIGLNLIETIPLIGAAVQTALSEIEGKRKMGRDGVVNPYMQIYRKIRAASKEDVGFKSVQPIIEIVIGAQLDPFIGVYNGVSKGFDEETIYDVLGISKSYRPTQKKEKASTKSKPIGKQDMEKYFPEMYEQLYGKGGSLEEYEKLRLEQEKIKRDELKRQKDLMYEYKEKPRGTVWSKK